MDRFLEIVSGEFVLRFMPNGGKAILLRSAIVSSIFYIIGIGIKSYSAEGAVLSFSAVQFWKEVGETIPWFGAVFGGSYAALYTRFSSQWSHIWQIYTINKCPPL